MTFDPAPYKALARLTESMARAAQAQDFETLSQSCADYEQLQIAMDASCAQTPAEVAQVETEIRSIIANQQLIAADASPWMEQVRRLLRENRQEQLLASAYRPPI